jgi:osmotically-inducible protein OsmY
LCRPCWPPALAGTLSACAPLIVGGAAVGGLVATDRRTSGAQLEDEGIELRAASRMREALGDRAHVNMTSYNRQVLLTGEVPSEQDKQLVEQIVSRVENVRAVVNELA